MNLKANKNFYTYIFFLLIFIIGINSYQDFGIYGDEPFHQWIGSIYYSHYKEIILNFNLNNEYIAEISKLSKDEYFRFWVVYPVFFDLLTEFLADILNIQNTKSIFQIRHLTNFLFFFISLVFFFKLILLRFKSDYLAILGVVLIFFSPRMFAESFYNSKDILFLSFSIINIYFSLQFIQKQSNKNLILYSLSTGLLIQSRIMGLIFPILTFAIILLEIKNNELIRKKLAKIIFSIFIILLVVLIFWPFIWFDFVKNLSFYLNFLQHLSGPYTNLYFGESILSNSTPWHFKFVWISISIPVSVLIFSLLGFTLIFLKFFNQTLSLDKNKNIWLNRNESLDFLVFVLILFTFIATLKFKNNFDGWRHIYYVYPLLIYFSIFFIDKIKNINFKGFLILIFIIIINTFYNAHWMIRNHPFQYTFFNPIHKIFIKKDFDLDYMGLSIKNSLEYILENDKRKIIKVSGFGETWINGNILILDEFLKKRLKVVNYNESDYIIDTFRPSVERKMSIDLKRFSKFYDLIVEGKVINRVYKKRN